jgi:hypothetical protein
MIFWTRSRRWWALLAVVLLGGACADDGDTKPDARADDAVDAVVPDTMFDVGNEQVTNVDSEGDADLAETGNSGDVAQRCLPGALDIDQDLRFSFTGSQDVKQISRNTSGGTPTCSAVSVSAMLTNPVHLVRYLGTWYFWYEEPYTILLFPSQGGVLLVSNNTSSPHQPFVVPADSNRKGIPLVVLSQDEHTLVLGEAPEARQVVEPLERVPLCTPYRISAVFGGNGLDNFSRFRLTLSLETGALEVSHSCLIHKAVSGCPQPTLDDSSSGTGTLICPDEPVSASPG